MATIISEEEFRIEVMLSIPSNLNAQFVTGPGRSGAIASVYLSHILGIPFLPYEQRCPYGQIIVTDTAKASGKTIRKALKLYEGNAPIELVIFNEPPRVKFWYEN